MFLKTKFKKKIVYYKTSKIISKYKTIFEKIMKANVKIISKTL